MSAAFSASTCVIWNSIPGRSRIVTDSACVGMDDNIVTQPMQAHPLSPREVAAVAASFLVATLALTFPVAVHPASTLPSDLVDTLLNTWIIGWDADRLGHGLREVWQ